MQNNRRRRARASAFFDSAFCIHHTAFSRKRRRAMKELKTLCPYCGVGCGMLAKSDGSRLVSLRGDPRHPANFGKLCHKGSSVGQTIDAPTRLRYAMLRETRGGEPLAVSPSRAIRHAADRLTDILQKHGPQAIGF